ncbi:MAG: sigma-70 family RNA polymerase sigma factor [Vitreoscilla sp.]
MNDRPATREEFVAELQRVRPELHRYCARMTGSTAEGEDVVQDTLEKALAEWSPGNQSPPLRPWLFRIAHNRAIDSLRRYERRMSAPLEDSMEISDDERGQPESVAARRQAIATAVSTFLELVPLQRSCVVLKDVLDYSLEEIADLFSISVAAVKSALHRGRARLKELGEPPRPQAQAAIHPLLMRYALLFDAHDWDGVRSLLAEDVRLEVVDRWRKSGRIEVGSYYANYSRLAGWRAIPGWLDGRPAIGLYFGADACRPTSFIVVEHDQDGARFIRDYFHVPYMAEAARFVRSSSAQTLPRSSVLKGR